MNDNVVNAPGGLPSKGNKKYGLIPQNNATNQFSRINSKRNSKKLPFNQMEITYKDVTAVFKGKSYGVQDSQFFDFILAKHFEDSNHDNNPVVSFTLQDYMEAKGLKSKPSASKSLDKLMHKFVGNLAISYSSGNPNNPYNHSFAKVVIFPEGAYKNGVASLSFHPKINKIVTQETMAMPYHILLLQLNPRKEATAYYLFRTILENKRMNAKKHPKRMNRIKVPTLLKNCPNLPTYEEVMNGNRNIDDRIIQPFLKGVERLSEAFDYSFMDNEGIPVNYEKETSYDDFIKWELVINWKKYPEDLLKQLTTHHNKKKKS